jgi:hypothetical protein
VVGQRVQTAYARGETTELINGQEVRVKETVNHSFESKPYSLSALMSVDMFYTHFRINQSWGEVLPSEDNVVLTNWTSCNPDKTPRETSGAPN